MSEKKAGKLVTFIILVSGVVFMGMSWWSSSQPLAVYCTIVVEPSDSADEAERIGPEDISVTFVLTDDLGDVVLMPDESSPMYRQELANAEKAMQNP